MPWAIKLSRTDPGPPGEVSIPERTSVGVFQPKLNQPSRNSGPGNLGKGRRCADVNRRRSSKDWMVEQIEGVHPELERM